MITLRSDTDNICIELNKDTTLGEFDKIIARFERLKILVDHFTFNGDWFDKNKESIIILDVYHNCLCWSKKSDGLSKEKVSVEEFLEEELPKPTIEVVDCPLCEKSAKKSLHRACVENQARIDKYGLGEDIEDDELYFKAIKEFNLKFKCPCFEYDESSKKFNKIEDCPFKNKPITFLNQFQALDYCYRNPLKEIEVYNTKYKQKYKIRYNHKRELFEWFGKFKTHYDTIECTWRTLNEFDYIYNWTNIKEVKEKNV